MRSAQWICAKYLRLEAVVYPANWGLSKIARLLYCATGCNIKRRNLYLLHTCTKHTVNRSCNGLVELATVAETKRCFGEWVYSTETNICCENCNMTQVFRSLATLKKQYFKWTFVFWRVIQMKSPSTSSFSVRLISLSPTVIWLDHYQRGSNLFSNNVSGAPNEDLVQNHLNIALLSVF